MPLKLKADDLDAATRSRLGVRKSRNVVMTKDQVRSNAFKCNALLAHLTQAERKRVLLHAIKQNNV